MQYIVRSTQVMFGRWSGMGCIMRSSVVTCIFLTSPHVSRPLFVGTRQDQNVQKEIHTNRTRISVY